MLTAIAASLLGSPAGAAVRRQAGAVARADREHLGDARAGDLDAFEVNRRRSRCCSWRRALLGTGFGLTVPVPQHLPHRSSTRSGPTGPCLHARRAARARDGACSGVRGRLRGAGFWWELPLCRRCCSGCSCRWRRASPWQAPLLRSPAMRGGTHAAVLAPHPVRPALRHLRDHEQQLVAAGHDLIGWASLPPRVPLALTAFWGMVTVGRLPVRSGDQGAGCWDPWCSTCCRWSWWSPPAQPRGWWRLAPLGVVVFGLAGLGCSALLPLTIPPLSQAPCRRCSAAVAGGVITELWVTTVWRRYLSASTTGSRSRTCTGGRLVPAAWGSSPSRSPNVVACPGPLTEGLLRRDFVPTITLLNLGLSLERN